MASATSNSSSASYATALTSLNPLEIVLYLAEYLEEWQAGVRAPTPGFAYTIGTVSSGSSGYTATSLGRAPSQVTVKSGAKSQVTVTAGSFAAATILGSQNEKKTPTGFGDPRYGGLEGDEEGKETRKQMMLRRRKECSVEEVDVALAPVLKINIPYVFYPNQYKEFRKLFPRVNVDSGLSYTHHDHPVAHTATMVGQRYMQGLLSSGEIALDLHGNPNGNERFNDFQCSRKRNRPNLPEPPIIETLVEMRTAMDAIRKVTKWGPKKRGTVDRYHEMAIEDIQPGVYNTFLSSHTLYYYSMYDVCKLLNKNPEAKLIALVNYSPEQSGKLYGELSFSKQDGMTTQTSPNGESYSHPDIDQWFQTNSFRGLTETIDSGISWTSTCIGGPLYVITITRCDWVNARHKRYDPPSAPVLKVSADRTFFGLMRWGGADVRLRVSNIALASELRHFMTFRDRSNPQTFADLCVKARRCTSQDLINGTTQYEVKDGDLQDHIVYAYLVDAPGELELMEGVKLLRGDLLAPLAEGLRLEGKDKKVGWLESDALYKAIFGRSLPVKALGTRVKPEGLPIYHRERNSGGLLPTLRT